MGKILEFKRIKVEFDKVEPKVDVDPDLVIDDLKEMFTRDEIDTMNQELEEESDGP